VDVISRLVQTAIYRHHTLSPVWAWERPLRIVVAVMADIWAGVEVKTAAEDLSAKSFPRYG